MPQDAQPFEFPFLALYGDATLNGCLHRAAQVAAWLEVERELAAAQADAGVIPLSAARDIALAAVPERIDMELLFERTRLVGYPILPLIEQLAAGAPEQVGRYLHWGATTQDIMDTADALRYVRALGRVRERLHVMGDELAQLAVAHQSTVMAGRTHGQQAVPTPFGAKVATWLDEFGRHDDRLATVSDRVATVELFGAAGTGAAMGPAGRRVRAGLAMRLGLVARDVPGHTMRDDLAELAFVLAAVCATCGKIAREIASLARTEIGELHEAHGPLRGASSTMPQKRNPITCEAIIGLSLMAINQVPILLSAMQAVHERATGEWQAEWDTVPFLFSLTGSTLRAGVELVSGLDVDNARMLTNLALDGGRIMSEAVMMALAPEIGRARAHEVVYAASDRALRAGVSLAEALTAELAQTSVELQLERALDPSAYLGESEAIAQSAAQAWRVRRTVP